MISFSALIIAQGKEELLTKCLDSLRPNGEKWQLVIVANGQRLSEEFEAYLREMPVELTLIYSEVLLTPGKARNLGLESCLGEWIFFIHEDSYVLPHYWEVVLPLLKEPKMDVIGGPDTAAAGMNFFSRGLAVALSSPFCTGTTFARHRKLGRKMVFADEEKLSAGNLWVRKAALGEIKFPEDYTRSEDILFLQKLSAHHSGMFYHPRLMVARYRHENILTLFAPIFRSGYFRSRSMRENLSRDTLAFWLPSVFVLLHLIYFFRPEVFKSLTQLYLGIILAVSLGLSVKNRSFFSTPLVVVLHYFIVFTYGLGFLAERFKRLLGK